jgi:hypothetical protein
MTEIEREMAIVVLAAYAAAGALLLLEFLLAA